MYWQIMMLQCWKLPALRRGFLGLPHMTLYYEPFKGSQSRKIYVLKSNVFKLIYSIEFDWGVLMAGTAWKLIKTTWTLNFSVCALPGRMYRRTGQSYLWLTGCRDLCLSRRTSANQMKSSHVSSTWGSRCRRGSNLQTKRKHHSLNVTWNGWSKFGMACSPAWAQPLQNIRGTGHW